MKGIGVFHEIDLESSSLTRAISVSQSVKEVLQSLVDDGLVNMDKIGSSNCTTSRRIHDR